MAKNRIGFAQVEPNYLTGIIEGKFYDQYPASATLGKILENGRFVKVGVEGTTAKNAVVTTGTAGVGAWYMIYNEEYHYDEREFQHKDFAMKTTDFADGVAYPRCIYVEVGDRFTTNAIAGACATDKDQEFTSITPVAIGAKYTVDDNGYLTAVTSSTTDTEIEFTVIPAFPNSATETTMADGTIAVKLIRTK